ncbi:DUF305 domain-containing protein [Bosea sp. 124]|uniref:CopM family metallochaperone n=1 Tax=Bosea sp. 124 TaxID=2135642 RepID=UPI000D36272F|nr:DUF305 domain-containing protein [Bosea sp. 124]PTM41855.1 hypothetical protein C8D03_3432 [Bosea sp. 124]
MNRLISTGIASAFISLLALGGPALAQQHQSHSSQAAPAAKTRDSVATTAYKAANMKMHKDMDIAFTGDADADFVRGMIPHHQGAIDMAKVVLAHGKDPALKTLATGIIADQEKEIAMMREWLKTNGK